MIRGTQAMGVSMVELDLRICGLNIIKENCKFFAISKSRGGFHKSWG
jgi:hypothetical protein